MDTIIPAGSWDNKLHQKEVLKANGWNSTDDVEAVYCTDRLHLFRPHYHLMPKGEKWPENFMTSMLSEEEEKPSSQTSRRSKMPWN